MSHSLLLKNLDTALEELKEIPLWGFPPPFSLEDFSEALSKSFEVEPIKVEIQSTDWSDTPLEGMGKDPFVRPFVLSPLPTEFFLALPQNALSNLAQALLAKEGSSKGFTDENLKEGFAEFVLLSTCQTFNQLNPFGNLSAAFADEAPLAEKALCINLSLTLGSKTISGRLIASEACLSAFRSYFEMEKPPLLQDKTLSHLPLSLSYEVGSTHLLASEWKEAKTGDFLLLDRCTFNTSENKGTAILSCGSVPLFDVRIKGEEAKILEYAISQKEQPMIEDQEPYAESPEEPTEMEAQEAKPLAADQIPLTLTVELGRFQMPLEKVTQLKPGNILDLQKSKEANVHLTVGGKRVATGELVAIGEAMGVKILKLGD